MLDLDAFKRIVETAAFHQLIGLKLEQADAATGIAVLRLPYDSMLSIFSEPGTYHGGVIAALTLQARWPAACRRDARPRPSISASIS
jgi:acyl-coenzyme A thioesterase PaaI-like protein